MGNTLSSNGKIHQKLQRESVELRTSPECWKYYLEFGNVRED
jgi:hypothetical protein